MFAPAVDPGEGAVVDVEELGRLGSVGRSGLDCGLNPDGFGRVDASLPGVTPQPTSSTASADVTHASATTLSRAFRLELRCTSSLCLLGCLRFTIPPRSMPSGATHSRYRQERGPLNPLMPESGRVD